MSEARNSGISKAMFVGGLIIAILVSGFVSIIIAIQLQSFEDPKVRRVILDHKGRRDHKDRLNLPLYLHSGV